MKYKLTDFSKHLTAYLTSYLPGLRNSSRNTITSYVDTFRLLLKYCRDICNLSIEKMTLGDINRELICQFLAWLEKERHCSIATRNQRLAAIHSFIRYLQVEAPEKMLAYQKILNIPSKKKGKSVVNYLTTADMKLILSQPDVTTPAGRRDLVLLSVIYDTGARVQEVADLTVRDIRLEYPARVHLTGKGQKSREVPLLSNTVSLLKNYLAEQKLTTKDKFDYPLFFNRQRNKLTRAGIAYILDKHVKQAALESPLIPQTVTPHVLRHTKAMCLLQAGVSLIYIKDILGHVDIGTTQIYASANTEMKKAALEQLGNISSLQVPPWENDTDLLTWLKDYGKGKS